MSSNVCDQGGNATTQSDLAAFRREFDEFSSRLDARIREFREKGRFSDLDHQFLTKAKDRADRLKASVAEAEKHGTPWDLLRAEAARIFNGLTDDVAAFERRFDAEFRSRQASSETKGRP
jgi:hypothetical protein